MPVVAGSGTGARQGTRGRLSLSVAGNEVQKPPPCTAPLAAQYLLLTISGQVAHRAAREMVSGFGEPRQQGMLPGENTGAEVDVSTMVRAGCNPYRVPSRTHPGTGTQRYGPGGEGLQPAPLVHPHGEGRARDPQAVVTSNARW